jgi:hypothetical protein
MNYVRLGEHVKRLIIICLLLSVFASCKKDKEELLESNNINVPGGFDIVVRVNPVFFETNGFKYLNMYHEKYNLVSYARELLYDVNIPVGILNEFSFGFDINNGFEYLLILNMKKPSLDTIEPFNEKLGLTKNAEDIYAGRYREERIFLFFEGNTILVSHNKNIIADVIDQRNIIAHSKSVDNIDIRISDRILKIMHVDNFDKNIKMINIEVSENKSTLTIRGNIAYDTKEASEGLYYILSGLKDTAKGILILEEDNGFMGIIDRKMVKTASRIFGDINISKNNEGLLLISKIDYRDIENIFGIDLDSLADENKRQNY